MRSILILLLCLFTIVIATWLPEEQITSNRVGNDLRMNNGHKVVVATNGVRHLVWFTQNSGVLYKRYYPGSGWTPDFKLSSSNSCFPSIALDTNGTTIHVVWQNKGGSGRQATWHIYYQKCVPGSLGNGGWVSTPRDITPNGGPHYGPAVACFQDHVVVTWFVWCRDTIGFCECVSGNWGNPIYFDDPSGTGKVAWNPSIAVDHQDRYGDVFISSHVTVPDRARIYVIRRHSGEWQAWEDATVDWDISCTESSVEVDPNTGCPHIVGGTISGSCVYHIYRDPSLGWRPPEIISDPSAVSCRRPSMFFSGSTAFVVWAESSSVYGIRYSIGNYGNWTLPAWVTSGYHDDNPHVTASSNGDVYVVWQDVQQPDMGQVIHTGELQRSCY